MLAGRGDIFLITDGQLFGTEDILARVRAAGVRVHCLGIGSAGQDRFLALLARQTGGLGRFLTPCERLDIAAVELFAAAGRPVADRLQVQTEGLAGARIAPDPPEAVFEGTPLVLFGDTDGSGQGSLEISWRNNGETRNMSVSLEIGGGRLGETLRLLQGARLITDLESRSVPGGAGSRGRREVNRIESALRALSEAYGLVSRQTALVAVVERAGDQPGVIAETRVVAVGMPEDIGFESYFTPRFAGALAGPGLKVSQRGSQVAGVAMFLVLSKPFSEDTERAESPEDVLLELARRLEPDGGMPGADAEARVLASVPALLVFLQAGHTDRTGAFRLQVRRLVEFLEQATLPRSRSIIVEAVLASLRRNRPVPGDWLREASRDSPRPELWDELAAALADPGATAL